MDRSVEALLDRRLTRFNILYGESVGVAVRVQASWVFVKVQERVSSSSTPHERGSVSVLHDHHPLPQLHNLARGLGQVSVSSRALSTMILRWSSRENDATFSKKSRGWAMPFGVRPVRAEEDPLDREVLRQLGDAVLDERRDPAVLDELVDRVAS